MITYFYYFKQYRIKNLSVLKDVLRMLSKKGHNLVNFGRGGSAAQAVERLSDGSLRAVCDYRKGGIPSGF